MLRADGVAITQQGGALQQVAQLPHIAGVRLCLQQGQRSARQLQCPGRGRHTLQQRACQQGGIALAFAQRWQVDGKSAQAVVQVFTKAPCGHHVLQVAVRGRHHAQVGMPQLGAAHAAVGAGLQQAQQLDLQRQGDVAHLVQKQRAAVGRLHQPRPGLGRAGERPFLMPEQLGLEQRLGQAGAVHRHQRTPRAQAALVHGMGHQLLARARLAQQQHRSPRGCHPRHQPQHLLERGRTPDEPLRRRHRLRRHRQRHHLFDKEPRGAVRTHQRRQLDLHIFLALGGVVHMQHPFALPRGARLREWAGLARLVTRHAGMVGHGVAGAPHHAALRTAFRTARCSELAAISPIGRQDAIAVVQQDVWIGQALQKGHQFGGRRGKTGHGKKTSVQAKALTVHRFRRQAFDLCHADCNGWQLAANLADQVAVNPAAAEPAAQLPTRHRARNPLNSRGFHAVRAMAGQSCG